MVSADGGLFDPAPLPGDDRLVVSAFSGLTWSLYTVTPDSQAHGQTFAVRDTSGSHGWTWPELADGGAARAEPGAARRVQGQAEDLGFDGGDPEGSAGNGITHG